jgi:hypothetical protein
MGRVAERGHCAVELVHHLRKIGDETPTIDAARGARAFVDACRAGRVLAGMTAQEAERGGIENHHRYFRVFHGKLNMAPMDTKSDWHFLESVDLGNGGGIRPSDHVQVVTTWQWPDAFDGVTARDLFAVQKQISEGAWRESSQSPDWAGKAVAEVLDFDLQSAPLQNRVKSLLKKHGLQVEHSRSCRNRTKLAENEVGQWAT